MGTSVGPIIVRPSICTSGPANETPVGHTLPLRSNNSTANLLLWNGASANADLGRQTAEGSEEAHPSERHVRHSICASIIGYIAEALWGRTRRPKPKRLKFLELKRSRDSKARTPRDVRSFGTEGRAAEQGFASQLCQHGSVQPFDCHLFNSVPALILDGKWSVQTMLCNEPPTIAHYNSTLHWHRQWHHVHSPKVGRHPPIARYTGTLQWHASLAPRPLLQSWSNHSTLRWHPAMAPRPLPQSCPSPSPP